jgi:hypothetical protein
MKSILYFAFLLIFEELNSQNKDTSKIQFDFYGDFYYSFDFSNPSNHEKPNYIYNHKRHNELNVNLVTLKSSYESKDIRANLSLMAGNYAQYNLANEPVWAQFINEANVGLRLSKNKELWLEAGIFNSHIGFESMFSMDCWTLTRSILAENSPYFESGVKLNYTTANKKYFLSFMYLNGWQNIQKEHQNQSPSFGAQIRYTPNDKLILNYSNFIGSTSNAFRNFHNTYLQYQIHQRTGIIVGFDFGMDYFNQKDETKLWYAPIIILKQNINKNFDISFRSEYYNDPKNAIINPESNNGFEIFGVSSNIDYKGLKKSIIRFEVKYLKTNNTLFDNLSNSNLSFTSNICVRL